MTAGHNEKLYSHSMVMLREHITSRVVESLSDVDLSDSTQLLENDVVVDWSGAGKRSFFGGVLGSRGRLTASRGSVHHSWLPLGGLSATVVQVPISE
jgi:hypothetical protein